MRLGIQIIRRKVFGGVNTLRKGSKEDVHLFCSLWGGGPWLEGGLKPHAKRPRAQIPSQKGGGGGGTGRDFAFLRGESLLLKSLGPLAD